jgi:hypothetical protein
MVKDCLLKILPARADGTKVYEVALPPKFCPKQIFKVDTPLSEEELQTRKKLIHSNGL